jgi:hypothetical protein
MVLTFHELISNPRTTEKLESLSLAPFLAKMDLLLRIPLLRVNRVRTMTGHISFEVASRATLKE